MKSNLKLAAGPFLAGDNVELQDLNNMMDESKESLKKSLSSLIVEDNKFGAKFFVAIKFTSKPRRKGFINVGL